MKKIDLHQRVDLKHLANVSIEDALKILGGEAKHIARNIEVSAKEAKALNDDFQELLKIIDALKSE